MAKFGIIETLNNLKDLIKELANGLRALTFADNFNSFEIDITLASGEERKNIRNQLTVKPTRYIIVHQTGDGNVTAGTVAWDINYITFKNHGSASTTVKIIVLR